MRWDDPVFTGRNGDYDWLVFRGSINGLTELVVAEHLGLRRCITAYDSGPFKPTADELAAGWTLQGEIAISPSLTPAIDIPCDQFDEWYLTDGSHFPTEPYTPLVNYGGFNLADPHQLRQSLDRTWDPSWLDNLESLQALFWRQLAAIGPITYVGTGDYDIVVSRRREFVERLTALAVRQCAPRG